MYGIGRISLFRKADCLDSVFDTAVFLKRSTSGLPFWWLCNDNITLPNQQLLVTCLPPFISEPIFLSEFIPQELLKQCFNHKSLQDRFVYKPKPLNIDVLHFCLQYVECLYIYIYMYAYVYVYVFVKVYLEKCIVEYWYTCNLP